MSYQRLERDAVLNLCVAQEMFRRMPAAGKGTFQGASVNNRNRAMGSGSACRNRSGRSIASEQGGGDEAMVADAVRTPAIFLTADTKSVRVYPSHFWEE